LDEERAEAIIAAAQEVMDGKWDDQFVVDPFQAGAGTSHNMNVNEVIANRATLALGGRLGEYRVHPNDHVNMAQSTNDTIPTAIRLGCLWRLDELLSAIDNLASALEAKATEFDDIVKSGRTHLQDAVPVRLGQEFGAYAKAVRRDAERIRRAAEGLRRLGIGGTAVGSGLNAHPEYHARMVEKLSELTGLELHESDNLFESMQSMADAADFSASLRTLALTLIRIANDFRLLSSGPSTGLDEIHLPAVQPGSSIMPGKVNPTQCEAMAMVAAQVLGYDAAVAVAGSGGYLEMNVYKPMIAFNVVQSARMLADSSDAFTKYLLDGMQPNRARIDEYLRNSLMLVTALSPLIGYDNASKLVHYADEHDCSLAEANDALGLVTEEEFARAVDPYKMAYPHT
jgi:fumarate hydratase class II